MKQLSILAAFVIAFAAHAQTATTSSSAAASSAARTTTAQTSGYAGTSTAGQANTSSTSASAAQATNLSAELTKKVDTKNAKVGDEVVARTTSAARLSDGTKLPQGTRLLGKVTDVQERSADRKTSRLAFTFDRAVMHNGNTIPIHATVMSLAPPAAVATNIQSDDNAMAGAGPVAVSGGGRTSASGGGLLGGAGGTLRGTGNVVGSTVGGVTSTTAQTLHTTANTAQSAGSEGLNTVGATASAAQMRVSNLPGVNFDSAAGASDSAALNAQGKNISVASGTQMMLSVSAGQ
ncbi:MAG: hypothetical protein JO300_03700 [Silvibacterium sp.]|nr:hypothetical protein [Silvibacterium sp.]